MADEQLPMRVQMLETRVVATERSLERLNEDVHDLRQLLTGLGERFEERFDRFGTLLTEIRHDTLQSMPPWAVEALTRKSVIITILASFLGVCGSGLIAALIALWHGAH